MNTLLDILTFLDAVTILATTAYLIHVKVESQKKTIEVLMKMKEATHEHRMRLQKQRKREAEEAQG